MVAVVTGDKGSWRAQVCFQIPVLFSRKDEVPALTPKTSHLRSLASHKQLYILNNNKKQTSLNTQRVLYVSKHILSAKYMFNYF